MSKVFHMKKTAKTPDHFSFRMERKDAELLLSIAAEANVNPGEFIRETVRDRIYERDLSTIRLQVVRVQRDTSDVRQKLDEMGAWLGALFEELRSFHKEFRDALPDGSDHSEESV